MNNGDNNFLDKRLNAIAAITALMFSSSIWYAISAGHVERARNIKKQNWATALCANHGGVRVYISEAYNAKPEDFNEATCNDGTFLKKGKGNL